LEAETTLRTNKLENPKPTTSVDEVPTEVTTIEVSIVPLSAILSLTVSESITTG
jgi:hypothetical protein